MRGQNLIVSEYVVRKATSGSVDPTGSQLIRRLSEDANAVIWISEHPASDTEKLLDDIGQRYEMVFTRDDNNPVNQLRKINFEYGYSIDMIVETDPNLVQQFLSEGWLVLAYFSPYYSKLDWRPGYQSEITAWDKLKAQVQLQARQHIEDVRVKPVL